MKAPECCPMCNEVSEWGIINESMSGKKGFSVGRAADGAVLLSEVGLVGGALGKRTVVYCCGACGFREEYDLSDLAEN